MAVQSNYDDNLVLFLISFGFTLLNTVDCEWSNPSQQTVFQKFQFDYFKICYDFDSLRWKLVSFHSYYYTFNSRNKFFV